MHIQNNQIEWLRKSNYFAVMSNCTHLLPPHPWHMYTHAHTHTIETIIIICDVKHIEAPQGDTTRMLKIWLHLSFPAVYGDRGRERLGGIVIKSRIQCSIITFYWNVQFDHWHKGDNYRENYRDFPPLQLFEVSLKLLYSRLILLVSFTKKKQ